MSLTRHQRERITKARECGLNAQQIADLTKLPVDLITQLILHGNDGKPIPIKPEFLEPPLF